MRGFRLIAVSLAAMWMLSSFASADDVNPAQIAALLESSAAPPDGFVRQKLDATDGLIFKPKDWYYTSDPRPQGWMWTLSQEDSSKGPYLTGMRIQMFLQISKGSSYTAESFAQYALQQLRTSAVSVVSDCPATKMGTFMRQCLETIEDSKDSPNVKFHIQYSVFWGGDTVVLATFGTPTDKWDSMKPIAQTMMAFRIVGANIGKQ